jgi:ATP phosphoribosyltransferase
MLRFAIPSKGSGYDGSTALLERCGLRIARATPRQYTALLRGLPDTEIRLHRPKDIVEKVAEGEIDIGITGLDLVREEYDDDDDTLLVLDENLGFWRIELLFAAPQTWVDVNSWQDLADISVELQAQGRPLRIATKFQNVVRRFCYAHGINVFHLVHSEGATEAAPGLGYADVIVDIVETGTALRDNQLKIVGGPLLRSHACLVGSRHSLTGNTQRLALVRQLLELIEAQRRGRGLHSLIANVPGESIEAVGRRVTERPELAGLQGPTIAPVWNKHPPDAAPPQPQWFAVNVVLPQDELLPAVEHLRSIGASTVTVTPVQYAFHAHSESYAALLERLQHGC